MDLCSLNPKPAMADDRDKRVGRFDDLNWLGKGIFISGVAVRLTARLVDRGIERAAATVRDSERAFRQGRDPNIEEATILEERDDSRHS